MKIEIELMGQTAAVEDGHWTSRDAPAWADALNAWTESLTGLGPGVGDVDVYLAGAAAKEYGAKILTEIPPPAEGDPNAIY